jgi:hypothetical protein
MQSPFITHRKKVLGQNSTAIWLRQLILSMWGGSSFQVGLSQLAGLDSEHADAAVEMLSSYRKNGEKDMAFMSLANECLVLFEKDKEDRAFNDGLDAQASGAGKESNPHLFSSDLHECWDMGWQQGADEDYEEDMNRE